MKVSELIELLKEVDPDREVVMNSDGEGNSKSPMYTLYEAAYRPDTTWSGETGLEVLTEEDIENGYSEEDVLEGDGVVPCIVLCPTN